MYIVHCISSSLTTSTIPSPSPPPLSPLVSSILPLSPHLILIKE